MMLLTVIGGGSFAFAIIVLFWWHPGAPLDVRVYLAGIYLLVTTVAVAGISVLMRLDALQWKVPQ